MKFTITGKNIEVTEALRNRIQDKVGRLEKFFHSEPNVHATMIVQKNTQTVEITIPFNRMVFKAVEVNDDMYTSIDKVVDSLERQLVKNKSRMSRKAHESKYKHPASAWGTDVKDEPEDVKFIKPSKLFDKPMSVDEAVLQLNVLDQNFFVFNNADSRTVNVVYKRNDGHIGLIEPEE